MPLHDRHILLGVTGGIAAYKAVDLASKLTGAGAAVQCILTENACRLAASKSFEAVTGAAVHTTMWTASEQARIDHIHLADWADLIVVAPATANVLAKMAMGLCDDLLSTTLCVCWEKPILVAPAMNSRMWSNPAVQANVETLKKRSVRFIGPEAGRLACGTQGPGRMAEPADILADIESISG